MFHFLYLTPTPTTETYTLSLHDALPISRLLRTVCFGVALFALALSACDQPTLQRGPTGTINLHGATTQVQSAALVERSEEHTSELQSHVKLVCRLLLEKKNVGSDCNQRT